MEPLDRARSYSEAFAGLGGDAIIGHADIAYIIEALTGHFADQPESSEIDLAEAAWSFESLGIDQAHRGTAERELIPIFERSFRLRASLLSQGRPPSVEDVWLLITSGVASQNQPQLREILREDYWFDLLDSDRPEEWEDLVLWRATRALYFLCRKRHGWQDLDTAVKSIRELVNAQAEREPPADPPTGARRLAATRLLGLYHLAECLAQLGEYLTTGLPDLVVPALERHLRHARALLAEVGDITLDRISAAASVVLPALARSSIWFNATHLSGAARGFATRLAQPDRDAPILELWWAQREALARDLLDPRKVAVGLQLPTSAGKTLLAEFSIVQALALNPGGTVVYVVPTRALVNQITRRLRRDLAGSRLDHRPVTVEAAVPVFELDPTEESLLTESPDVLVTTPEKLDLLVRTAHPSVREMCLVVVDEAHHIAEPTRGPRLEMVLATIKRERGTSCRYLLLTPFLPNATELARWLGDDAYAAINLDWRPSLQVRALAKWKLVDKRFQTVLELVPSASQPAEWQDVEIELGPAIVTQEKRSRKRSRPRISVSTAAALVIRNRATLVLTKGMKTAETRAAQIAEHVERPVLDPANTQLFQDAVAYIRTELGADYPLVAALERGVAFHHAGVPPDVRAIVELMIERGCVRAVTGTTTLGQGVDFPLSAVVVETLTVPRRGQQRRTLEYSEFWNIAGRAGRALQDRVGLVAWPAAAARDGVAFTDYLKGEAATVASALLQAFTTIDETAAGHHLALVRDNPGLGSFLQYLAHALRVGGYDRASAEVEDILRCSLVFRHLDDADDGAAERLVQWSRSFLEANRDGQLLEVADATGLSLPSLGLLAARAPKEMSDPGFWAPDHLFGTDLTPLTSVLDVLSQVPEMSLGVGHGGMTADRIAALLRGWVNGASLTDLARSTHPGRGTDGATRKVGRYLYRELTGQVPWGLGALQLVTLRHRTTPDLRRVPAMAYYGVRSANAIKMRMVGVPRTVAEALGAGAPTFSSFAAARRWISMRPDSTWESAAGDTTAGRSLRRIWSLLNNEDQPDQPT